MRGVVMFNFIKDKKEYHWEMTLPMNGHVKFIETKKCAYGVLNDMKKQFPYFADEITLTCLGKA